MAGPSATEPAVGGVRPAGPGGGGRRGRRGGGAGKATGRAAATGTLTTWAGRYVTLIRAGWLVDLQYRAAIALWILWGVMEPVIALGIWWSVAGGGEVEGYARGDFARYFFGVALVGQATLAWDAWYLDRWIRGGELNYRLVRPIAPIHEAISDNLAYKARAATLTLLLWAAVAVVWPAVRIPFEPDRWALAALATLLAAGIRFLNGYATGLLAFWTTRAIALSELQYGVSLFLSGRIAPLALLPGPVAAAGSLLWFPWMLAFPVEVLTGTVSGAGPLAAGFGWQLAWLVAWTLVCRWTWRRGVLRYGAVGG